MGVELLTVDLEGNHSLDRHLYIITTNKLNTNSQTQPPPRNTNHRMGMMNNHKLISIGSGWGGELE